MCYIQDLFEVKSGLKQGDALSPALFNLALEKIIRDTNDDRRMEISNEQVMLAYADDIVLMGETKEEIINSTSKLINASKGIGLHVNEGKTKYMVVSRRPPNINSIIVDNYKFEKVNNFKYLGVNINNGNDMHIEINERITSGNRCYFSIIKLLRSKLLSRGSKILLYHSYLRPVITYACETWSLTKGDSRRLIMFERKVLRIIYGPIFNPETQTYERKNNENIKSLYNKLDILYFIRKKRLEWFGHAWKADGQLIKNIYERRSNENIKSLYNKPDIHFIRKNRLESFGHAWRADGQLIKNVLINKINKTRPLGRPKTRWIDVVAKDIEMIDQDATLETAYQRERWREILMAAMVLNGPLS
ncbi:Reverse transcriptase domain [Cinara cedri]|uniref:Reverse transcriptase domain n=1 Tax=Cinara cedri TaxID=506608 RepID=A0A5E4MZ22_9HEMI|nr:Reverse transcriptase domain [Cinara cedri]